MTPELFDALVIAVMMIGLSLAALRFWYDLRRPLPPLRPPAPPAAHSPTQES